MRLPFGLVAVLFLGCTRSPAPSTAEAAPNEPGTFTWPVPQNWRSETIPFPLAFAPELAYRGREEIRFAPKFFDPHAETYFSYSFVWLLDDAPPFDGPRLSDDVVRYFSGLSRSVAPKRFDPEMHRARIAADDGRFRGVVETVDSFGDGRRLQLALEGEETACGARRAVLLSLSPQPAGHPVWSELRAHRRTFRCR